MTGPNNLFEVSLAIDELTTDHEDACVSYEALVEWWTALQLEERRQLLVERMKRELEPHELEYVRKFEL